MLPALAALALVACAAQRTTQPPPASTAATPPAETQPSDHPKAHAKPAAAKNDREALAPADVGYYLDVLEGRLKQEAGADVAIARQEQRIVLDLSQRVSFGAGSARIDTADRGELVALSKVLVEYRTTRVSLQVSADAADPSALQLAKKRARAVARCLTESGVAARRIVAAALEVAGPPARAGQEDRVQVEMRLEPIVRAADKAPDADHAVK